MNDETKSLSAAAHKRLYDQAAALAGIGAWECDLATGTLSWTNGVYDLFDLPRGSAVERAMVVDLYEDDSRRRMEALRAAALRGEGGFTLDALIETRRGASRWMRLTADVAYANGLPARLFGAKQDITREKALWDRLREQAERDPLTGLANRGVFEARFHALTKGTSGEPCIAALALIDLDHFKAINDRLGHLAGDECLRQSAMRLQRVFGDAILVSRLGGDEFAVLLRAPLGLPRIVHMLERVLRSLNRPVSWDTVRVEVGASIGAAIVTDPPRTLSQVFAEADAALYAAKAAGRNTVRIHGQVRVEGSLVSTARRTARR